MRAVLVSVDYDDLLAITLPYNRHHFDEVLVVTTPRDDRTIELAEENEARVFATEAFYQGGAIFNKWLALEQALDEFGRNGVIALMDADVLWPKELPPQEYRKGFLYSPYRRLFPSIDRAIPEEGLWSRYPRAHDIEWAGYTQIFHADDPHLPEGHWHETTWLHAGGADSFFQSKWPEQYKVRPNWDVLHLGMPGENWCGRVSRRVDGKTPRQATRRKAFLRFLMGQRLASLRLRRRQGVCAEGETPVDPYTAERMSPSGVGEGLGLSVAEALEAIARDEGLGPIEEVPNTPSNEVK